MTEFFKKSVKPLRIFSKAINANPEAKKALSYKNPGALMAFSMIEAEWHAAFYRVLEEDFKNGKLVLTEDQETRIDQLFNKRMESFKNGKF